MAARHVVPSIGPSRHRRAQAIGAAAAAVLAGIHVARLARAAREAGYLGVMFAVAAACFGWVAVRLFTTDDVDGWLAGASLAIGVGAGYVLSCTVGLPGISREHWSLLGDASTGVATVLLLASVARIRSDQRLSNP